MEGIYALAWSPDGRWLAAGGSGQQILIWNVHQGAAAKILTAPYAPVRSLSWSGDNSLFACGHGHWKALATNHVQVWRVQDGEIAWTAREVLPGAYAVSFSPDNRWLVSGHGNGITMLWQAQTGKPLLRSTVNEDIRNLINGIDFSPNSQQVACGTCYENALYIYGIDGTVKQERFFPAQPSWIDFEHPIRYSPNQRWLARGSQDGRIHLWRTHDLSELQLISDHQAPVYALSWHPNSHILTSGSRFGFIQFWDINTQEECGSIQYRPFHVLAFSPDGRFLASGGDEKRLHIWHSDPKSDSFGQCAQVLG